MNQKQILITGGAGFIGSHVADKLYDMGHEVRILDSLRKPIHLKGKPDYLNNRFDFIKGDVRDKKTMQKALEDVNIVFHLAAYQDYLPDYSTFTHINTYSTSLIYEIIEEKKMPIEKVIVASSQAVMGEGKYISESNDVYFPDLRKSENFNNGIWNHLDNN